MFKKTVIFFIPILFVAFHGMEAKQADLQLTFEQANVQFKQGHIRKALSLYKKLEQKNRVSGALFINMGMSYIRLDSLGKAEYYFLKAKQFKITNERAEQGLSYVKHNLSHQSAVLPTLPWQSFFTWLKRNIGVTILLGIGLVLVNLSVILFILPWFLNRLRRTVITTAIVLVVIGILTISSSFYINYRTHRYHKAVMISQNTNVQQKPNTKSAVVNKAYTGYIFTVDQRKSRKHEGWVYIRMSNGQYGWIRSDEIMVL